MLIILVLQKIVWEGTNCIEFTLIYINFIPNKFVVSYNKFRLFLPLSNYNL